ncbi:hypothetical protein ILYODFUR_017253 [Ilyodon furcidens]|uniref:Uncharacterized protein n=1 Tax=Ilyodon furcidens TaxID=33524 RepID=A0ABV0TLX5_9TELE
MFSNTILLEEATGTWIRCGPKEMNRENQQCVRRLREERLNKQADPGTKSQPLKDMWQQNPLNPHPYPSTPLTLPTETHQLFLTPWMWSQEKQRWRRRGRKF